jgi:hypothetical protein
LIISVRLEHTIIKQADVVLLGFPLIWPMGDEVRQNDLLAYEPLTRADGPAMTWSMYSIGFTELGDFHKADQLFRRSYESYVRPPFNVSYLTIFSFIFLMILFLYDRYGQKLDQVLVQLIL